MSWNIKIHTANVDAGTATPPYDAVAVADLLALSGYQTATVEVLSVDEQIDPEGEQIAYANGSIGATQQGRKSYTFRLPAVSYLTRNTFISLFSVSGLNLIKAKYCWLEFYTESQAQSTNVGDTYDYMPTVSAIPVVLQNVDWTHNHDSGTKELTLTFKRKYLLA